MTEPRQFRVFRWLLFIGCGYCWLDSIQSVSAACIGAAGGCHMIHHHRDSSVWSRPSASSCSHLAMDKISRLTQMPFFRKASGIGLLLIRQQRHQTVAMVLGICMAGRVVVSRRRQRPIIDGNSQLNTQLGRPFPMFQSDESLNPKKRKKSNGADDDETLRNRDTDDNDDTEGIPIHSKDSKTPSSRAPSSPQENEKIVSSAMVASLGFYKQFISPLLPPACRFVPTCSQYGVQAIQDFGPGKGAILIAWRLLRCSPIGGKGYDPPKWPPVPYTYSSY